LIGKYTVLIVLIILDIGSMLLA